MNKELAKTYDPKDIEERLYQKWQDKKYFHAEVDRSKNHYHCNASSKHYWTASHGACTDNTMGHLNPF